jgi:hypothetical protein
VQLLVVVVLVFPGLVNRGVLLAEHTLLDMPVVLVEVEAAAVEAAEQVVILLLVALLVTL